MIVDVAEVKTLARLANISGDGAPSTGGEEGDIYLDRETGDTFIYESGAWVAYTEFDDLINTYIPRAVSDYLLIRKKPFDEDENGDPVVPDGDGVVLAEMVCYLAGLGDYEGRGLQSESVGGRNASFDDKIRGYPKSIVGGIRRYVRAL